MGGPASQVHPEGCGGTVAQPLQVLAEAPLAVALPTGHLAGVGLAPAMPNASDGLWRLPAPGWIPLAPSTSG